MSQEQQLDEPRSIYSAIACSRLVIFDVDGTLVDSQHDIVEAQRRAFTAHGLSSPSRERALSVVGLSLNEAFVHLAGPAAPIDSLAEAYKMAWMDLRAAPDYRDILYQGAAEAIAALTADPDTILGIATGKSRRGVDRILAGQGWTNAFATIQTADTHPSKPDPSMVQAALAETGVSADRAWMIGDTTYDMEMAVAAGIRPIGVAWGYHAPDALVRSGAVAIAESFDALRTVLDGFANEPA